MADEGSSSDMLTFKILQLAVESNGPRLGRFAIRERNAIDTPHYISNTSRGVVSHLSQDNYARHTSLMGAYVALEDCKQLPSASTISADGVLTAVLVP